MNFLSVEQAVEALKSGGIIAYPTEGVYGLGCDPFNEQAVLNLLKLKQRPVEKGLILVASGQGQIAPLVNWEGIDRDRVLTTWPGPVTWTLPATDRVPVWIRGRFDTVAIRISAHPVVQALCKVFAGPLVSTSANLAGMLPAMSCEQVGDYFGDRLTGCVQGRLGGHTGPTPIFDARTGAPLRF